jgi:putative two-component system response regulator
MTKAPVILVVDDEAPNRMVLEGMLISQGYDVALAEDGPEALRMVAARPPDVVLLDVMMPDMDGFEVLRRLRDQEETRHLPVVMVTALSASEHRVRSLDLGADDFLTKPVDMAELRARVRSLVQVKAFHDHMQHDKEELEAQVQERTRALRRAMLDLKAASLETVLRLSRAAEYKDDDTGEHVLRMSRYAAAIATKMALSEQQVEEILHAAPMHDVGKIGIPDRVLMKPGRLDEDEWQLMRRHCKFGQQILADSKAPVIQLAESIALNHHEKWDGSGYPRGLKGGDIPLSARIVAAGDVFDALTSRRPYKEAFTVERSLDIMREGRGSHFDPAVLDAFLATLDEILNIRARVLDQGIPPMFSLNE